MTTIARVIHNYDKGSGDYVIIQCEDFEFKGHSLHFGPEMFVNIVEILSMADSIKLISLTDEEIEQYD